MEARAYIIIRSGYKREFFKCACLNCTGGDKDIAIPEMTGQEAEEKGWRASRNIEFCPPDEDLVLICPDCAKELDLKGSIEGPA